MFRTLSWVISLLGLLLVTQPKAWALDFQSALEQVWLRNPSLIRAKRALGLYDEKLAAAKGAYGPELNAKVSYSKRETIKGESSTSGVQNEASTALELSQNLFSGLSTKAAVESARSDKLISEQEALLSYSQIGVEFLKSYSSVYFALKSQKLTEEILGRRKSNYELVKLRFEAGSENKGSLLVAKSSLDEAQFDVDKSSFDLNIATQTLEGLMATALGEVNQVEVIPTKTFAQTPAQIERLQEIEEAHPTIKSELSKIDKAKSAITTSRSSFFPKLGLSASFTQRDERFYPDQSEGWSAGLTLTIPLYRGGQDLHDLNATKIELERSVAALEKARYDQKNELTGALYNLRSATQRVRVSQSSMEAAKVRREISREKYNNGLLSFEDWSTIEDDYALKQKNYLEAQSAQTTAKANWMLATGDNPFRLLTSYNEVAP